MGKPSFLSILLGALALPLIAQGKVYPTKRIKIPAPFPVGGTVNFFARTTR